MSFPTPQSYLQSLHDCYEEWLGDEKHHNWHGDIPVLVSARTHNKRLASPLPLLPQVIDGNEDCMTDNTIHNKNSSKIINRLGRLTVSDKDTRTPH